MEAVSLTIDPATVKGIVQSQIQAAVASALNINQAAFVEQAVKMMFNYRVDNEGKHQDYDSYNKIPWIDWACRESIRKAVKTEIDKWLIEHREELAKEIRKALASSKMEMVKKLADGCAASLIDGYSFKFDVKMTPKE